jgi:hypothetical protein
MIENCAKRDMDSVATVIKYHTEYIQLMSKGTGAAETMPPHERLAEQSCGTRLTYWKPRCCPSAVAAVAAVEVFEPWDTE